MKSLKVAKMNISGILRPATIYYGIVLAMLIITIIANNTLDGSSSVSGIEMITIIFLFVAGLNSFKNNFYFAKSNNISRKSFINGLLLSILPIALVMSIIDIIINRFLNLCMYMNSPTLYDQTFAKAYAGVAYGAFDAWIQSNSVLNIFNTLLFHFSFCLIAYALGITIRIIFYKCNKVMKILIIVVPIISTNFVSSILYLNPEIAQKVQEFTNLIFGFDPVNVYTAATTFIVLALALGAISFLLVRKAVIKER